MSSRRNLRFGSSWLLHVQFRFLICLWLFLFLIRYSLRTWILKSSTASIFSLTGPFRVTLIVSIAGIKITFSLSQLHSLTSASGSRMFIEDKKNSYRQDSKICSQEFQRRQRLHGSIIFLEKKGTLAVNRWSIGYTEAATWSFYLERSRREAAGEVATRTTEKCSKRSEAKRSVEISCVLQFRCVAD